jgi:predicted AAA+ superfamily ATPase
MLPLSFYEYWQATGKSENKRIIYRKYLENSSFPYALELEGNQNLIDDYLNGIFNTIVLKDVVARKRISDVMMLESVIRFIFSNIGNLVSIKKISDTMTSRGRKISTHTVESYIQSLMDSFIIHQVRRYDIKGKEYLKTLEKYYVADIGLRFIILGRKNSDWGFILENIIFLELIRRGYKVYIGKAGTLEIDFVASNSRETVYYQVALTVRDKATLERELAPLRKIRDDYPKILLTLDEDPDEDFEGIRKINALNFLLDD